jgi:hypothetical protein
MIGPEPIFAPAVHHPGVASKDPAPAPSSNGHSGQRPTLITGDAPSIDRQAFLLAFRRQSPPVLLPCLRLWQPSPGSVLLTGSLDRRGMLTNLSTVGFSGKLPTCALTAIRDMRFEAAAKTLRLDMQTLEWRVDW